MAEVNFKFIDPELVDIVALDIGVEHTGLFYKGEDRKFVAQIENDEHREAFKPYHMSSLIIEKIMDIPDRRKVLLVVEDYSFGRSFFNMLQPEIFGSLKSFVIAFGEEFVGAALLAPSTIKKHVAGKGKATKSEMKKAVKSLGYKVSSSHEADAISAYLTYMKVWDGMTEGTYRRSFIL